MKIVFLVPGSENRPLPINGETMRYGNAPSSGTEQSTILVGEYLANQGHEVTIVLSKTDFKTVNKVNYTDFTYKDIDVEIDILVTMLWFDGYKDIPFKVTKQVVHWFHMAWGYAIGELSEYCLENKVSLKLINPSNFAQFHNSYSFEFHTGKGVDTKQYTIPNPLDTQLIKEIQSENIEKDPKKVIFHAQFSRGGKIAKRVVQEYGEDFTFKHFDYVEVETGVGRAELLRELASASYFIFPLYHPNKCVYKDTFSCAVAEAAAMKVKTITYPLGAFPEYFNDVVYYANFPQGININKMYSEKVSCEVPEMEDHTEILKVLTGTIKNPDTYFPHFEFECKKVTDRFSIEQVGKLWNNLILNYNE